MSETRISKIQVRRGNIVDLPLLDAGEFGYALDEQRLFIGNEITEIGIGNGLQKTFALPNLSEYPAGLSAEGYRDPRFYVDGQEISGVEIKGNTAEFAVAPNTGVVVTAKWNSEVEMRHAVVAPGEERLDSLSSQGSKTEFQFDKDAYSAVFMNYTLRKNQTAVITGTEKNAVANIGDSLVINGLTINFETDANSNGFASLDDIVTDINKVFPGTASNADGYLKIEFTGTDITISGTATQDVGIAEGTHYGYIEIQGTVLNPSLHAPYEITINGTTVKFIGNSISELVQAINYAFRDNDSIYALEQGNRLAIYSDDTDLVVEGREGPAQVGIAVGTYPVGETADAKVSTYFDISGVDEGDSIVISWETGSVNVIFTDTSIEGIISSINNALSGLGSRIIATPHPEAYYGIELIGYGIVPQVRTDIRNLNILRNAYDAELNKNVDLDIRVNGTLVSFAAADSTDITPITLEDVADAISEVANVTATVDLNQVKISGDTYNDDVTIEAGDITVTILDTNIQSVQQGNPATITTNIEHGLETGDEVTIQGLAAEVGELLNGNTYTVTVVSDKSFTIDANTIGVQFWVAQSAQLTGNVQNVVIEQSSLPQTIVINDNTITLNLGNLDEGVGKHNVSSVIRAINTQLAEDSTTRGIEAINVNNRVRLIGTDTNIEIGLDGGTELDVEFISWVSYNGGQIAKVTTVNPHGLADGSGITIGGVNGMPGINKQNFYVDVDNDTIDGALGTDQFYIFYDSALTSAVNPTSFGTYADAQPASVTGATAFPTPGTTVITTNSSFDIETKFHDAGWPTLPDNVAFLANDTLEEVVEKINLAGIEGITADVYNDNGDLKVRITADSGYAFEIQNPTSGDNALGYMGIIAGTYTGSPSGTVHQNGATLLGFPVGTTAGLTRGETTITIGSEELNVIGNTDPQINDKEYFSQGTATFVTDALVQLGLTAGKYIRTLGNTIILDDGTEGTLAALGITEASSDLPYEYPPTLDNVIVDTPVVQAGHSIKITPEDSAEVDIVFGTSSTLAEVVETINLYTDQTDVVASIGTQNDMANLTLTSTERDFTLAAGTGSAFIDLALESGTHTYTEESKAAWTGLEFGQGSRDLEPGDQITFTLTDTSEEVVISLAISGTDLDDVIFDLNNQFRANTLPLTAVEINPNKLTITGDVSFTLEDNQGGQVLQRIGFGLFVSSSYTEEAAATTTGNRYLTTAQLFNGHQIVVNGITVTFESSDGEDNTPITLAEVVDQINTAIVDNGDFSIGITASIVDNQIRFEGVRTDVTLTAPTWDSGNRRSFTVRDIDPTDGTVEAPNHKLQTGDRIYIEKSAGTFTNGYYTVEVIDANTLELPGVTDTGWQGTGYQNAVGDLRIDTLIGNTYSVVDYANARVVSDPITPTVNNAPTDTFVLNGILIASDDTDFTNISEEITAQNIEGISVVDQNVLKISSTTGDITIGGTALEELDIVPGTYNNPAHIISTQINPTLTPGNTIELTMGGSTVTIQVPTADVEDLVDAINTKTDNRVEIVSENFGETIAFASGTTMTIDDGTSTNAEVVVPTPGNTIRTISTTNFGDAGTISVNDTFTINGIVVRVLVNNPSKTVLQGYINSAFANHTPAPYTYVSASVVGDEVLLTSQAGVDIVIGDYNSGNISDMKQYLGFDSEADTVIVDELDALVDNINETLTSSPYNMSTIVAEKYMTPVDGYQLKLYVTANDTDVTITYEAAALALYTGIPAGTYTDVDLNLTASAISAGFTIVGTGTDIVISTPAAMSIVDISPYTNNTVVVEFAAEPNLSIADTIKFSFDKDNTYTVTGLVSTTAVEISELYDSFPVPTKGGQTALLVDDNTDSNETLLEQIGIDAGYYTAGVAQSASVVGAITDPTISGCHGLNLAYGLPGTPGYLVTDVFFTSGPMLADVVNDINAAQTGITAESVNGQLVLRADRAITIKGYGSALADLGVDSDDIGLEPGNHRVDATVQTSSDDYNSNLLTPGGLTINGSIVGFTGTTLQSVINDINNAGIEGVSAGIAGANQLQIEGNGTDITIGLDEGEANVHLGVAPGYYPANESAPAEIWSKYNPDVNRGDDLFITANNQTYRVLINGTTLNDMIGSINNAAIPGIVASNDQNRLKLTGNDTDIELYNGQVDRKVITQVWRDLGTGVVTVEALAHGFINGQRVFISNVGGTEQLNNNTYYISVVDNDTFTLNGVDGSEYGEFAPASDAVIVGSIVNPVVSDNDVIGITTSAGDSRQVIFNDTTYGLDLDGVVSTINNKAIPGVTASKEGGILTITGEGVDITLSANERSALISDVQLVSKAIVVGNESVVDFVPARQSLTVNNKRIISTNNLPLQDFLQLATDKNISGVEFTLALANQFSMTSDSSISVGRKTAEVVRVTLSNNIATVTTAIEHDLISGDVITFNSDTNTPAIAGEADYAGKTFRVIRVNNTQFRLDANVTGFVAYEAAGDSTPLEMYIDDTALTTLGLESTTYNVQNNAVTITALSHGFITGDKIRFGEVHSDPFNELDNTAYKVSAINSDQFQLCDRNTGLLINGTGFNIEHFSEEADATAISLIAVMAIGERFRVNGMTIQPTGGRDVADIADEINTEATNAGVDITAVTNPSGNLVIASSTTDIVIQAITETTKDISKIELLGGTSVVVTTDTAHGFSDSDYVRVTKVEGVTGLNENTYRVRFLSTKTFELVNADPTVFASYVFGGIVTKSPLVNLGIVPGTYEHTPSVDPSVTSNGVSQRIAVGRDFIINGVPVTISPDDSTSADPENGLATLTEVVADIAAAGISDISAEVVDLNDSTEGLRITANDVDLVIERGLDSEFAVISNIEQTNLARVTVPGNNCEDGDYVLFEDIEGMTELNGNRYQVTSRGGVGYTPAVAAKIVANIANADFRNGHNFVITDEADGNTPVTIALDDDASFTSTNFGSSLGDYDHESRILFNDQSVLLTTTATETGSTAFAYDSVDDKEFSINGVVVDFSSATTLAGVISVINTKMDLEGIAVVATDENGGNGTGSGTKLKLTATNVDLTIAESDSTDSSGTLADLGLTAGTTLATLTAQSVVTDINSEAGVNALVTASEVSGEVKISIDGETPVTITYEVGSSVDIETYIGIPSGTVIARASSVVQQINDHADLEGLIASIDSAGRLVIDGQDDADFSIAVGDEVYTVELSSASRTSPVRVTSINHGLSDGEMITINNVAGMTELNGGVYAVNVFDAHSFDLYEIIEGETFDKTERNNVTVVEELLPLNGTEFTRYEDIDDIFVSGTVPNAIVDTFPDGTDMTMLINGITVNFGQPPYDLASVVREINNAQIPGINPSATTAVTVNVSSVVRAYSQPLEISTVGSHTLNTGDVVTFANVGGAVELNGNSYSVETVDSNTFKLVDGYSSDKPSVQAGDEFVIGYGDSTSTTITFTETTDDIDAIVTAINGADDSTSSDGRVVASNENGQIVLEATGTDDIILTEGSGDVLTSLFFNTGDSLDLVAEYQAATSATVEGTATFANTTDPIIDVDSDSTTTDSVESTITLNNIDVVISDGSSLSDVVDAINAAVDAHPVDPGFSASIVGSIGSYKIRIDVDANIDLTIVGSTDATDSVDDILLATLGLTAATTEYNDTVRARIANSPAWNFGEYTAGGEVSRAAYLKLTGVGTDIVIAENTDDSAMTDSVESDYRTIDIADISNTIGIDDLGFTDGQSDTYIEAYVSVTGTGNDAIVNDGETLEINNTIITFTGTTGLTLQDVVDEITAALGSDSDTTAEVYTAGAHTDIKAFTSVTDGGSVDIEITAAGHGFATGDQVVIDGTGDSVDGIYTITVTGVNTFTLDNTSDEVFGTSSGTVQAAQYLRITRTGGEDLFIGDRDGNTQLGLTWGTYTVDANGVDEVFATITSDITTGTTAGQQIVINDTVVEFTDTDVLSGIGIANRITLTVDGVTATVTEDDSTSSTSTDDYKITLTGDADVDITVEAGTQVTVVTQEDHNFASGLTIHISGVSGLTAINDATYSIDHAADDRFVLNDFVIDSEASDYDSTYEGYVTDTGVIKSSALINLGLTEGTTTFTPNGTAQVDAVTSLGLVVGTVEHTADIDPMYVGLTAEPEVLPGSDIYINGEQIIFQDTDSSSGSAGVVDVNEIIYQIDNMTSGDEIDAVGYQSYDLSTAQNIEGFEILTTGEVQVDLAGHGYTTGDTVQFDGILVEGLPTHALNGDEFTITVVDANTFTLDGSDSTVHNDIAEIASFTIEIVRHTFGNDIVIRTQDEHNITSGNTVRLDGFDVPGELNYSTSGVYTASRLDDYEFSLNNTRTLTDVELRKYNKTDSDPFVITRPTDNHASGRLRVELVGHNLDDGNRIKFTGLDISTELNYDQAEGNLYQVIKINDDEFELLGTEFVDVTLDSDSAVDSTDGVMDDNTSGVLTVIYGGVSQDDSTGLGIATKVTGTVTKKLTHVKVTSNNESLIVKVGDVDLTVDIAGIDNYNADGLVEIYTQETHHLHTGDLVSFGDLSTLGGLDNTGPWTITVTGDKKFTVGTAEQGVLYPEYGNPTFESADIVSGIGTRSLDNIIINGTTVDVGGMSITEVVDAINNSDVDNVEAKIVERITFQNADGDITLGNFVATVNNVTIDDNVVTIRTNQPHGLQAGDAITIADVVQPTQLNSSWTVDTVVSSEIITLTDITDKSSWLEYTSGGNVQTDNTLIDLGFGPSYQTATADALRGNNSVLASSRLIQHSEVVSGTKFVVNGLTVTVTGNNISGLQSGVRTAVAITSELVTAQISQYLQIVSYGQDLTVDTTNDSAADDIRIDGIYTHVSPVLIRATDHGLATGSTVELYGIVGTTELNNERFEVSVIDDNWFTLPNVDVSLLSEYTGNSVVTGTSVAPNLTQGDDIIINGETITFTSNTINGIVNNINNANITGVYARNNAGALEITSVGEDLILGRGEVSRTTRITNISKTNPCVVTAPGHALQDGSTVIFEDIVGMTQLNYATNGNTEYTIQNVTANTFELAGVNSIAFFDYVQGENATVTSANTNATVFAGHGMTINDIDVVFLGTNGPSVVNAINDAEIPGVFAQFISGQVRITGDETDVTIADNESADVVKTITNATNSSPMVITVPSHGLRSGETIDVGPISGMTGFGTGSDYEITKLTDNTFSIPFNASNAASVGSFQPETDPTATGSHTDPRIARNGHNLFINGSRVEFNGGGLSSIVQTINNAGITGVTAEADLDRVTIISDNADLVISDNDGTVVPETIVSDTVNIAGVELGANTIVSTVADHNLSFGVLVKLENMLGSTELNNTIYRVRHVIDSRTFEIGDIDGAAIDTSDSSYGEYQNTTNAEVTGTEANPTVRFGDGLDINGITVNVNNGTLYQEEVISAINTQLANGGIDYITASYNGSNRLVLTSDTSAEEENIVIRNYGDSNEFGVAESVVTVTSTPIEVTTPDGSSIVSDGETFAINGTLITMVGTTLEQVVNGINDADIPGVEASYNLNDTTAVDIITVDHLTDAQDVTVTTATAHGFAIDDIVIFVDADSTLDYATSLRTFRVDTTPTPTSFTLRATAGGDYNWDSSAIDKVQKSEYDLIITATGYNLTITGGSMDLADIGLVADTYYTGDASVTGTVDMSAGIPTGATFEINSVGIVLTDSLESTLDNIIDSINTAMDTLEVDITASNVGGQLHLAGGASTDITIGTGSISANSVIEDITIDTANEIYVEVANNDFIDGDRVTIDGVLGMEGINGETFYVEVFTSDNTVRLYTDKALSAPAAESSTEYEDFAKIAVTSSVDFSDTDTASTAGDFTINSYTIIVAATDTIDDIVTKINTALPAIENIRARNYSVGGTDRLQIIGNTDEIVLANTDDDVLEGIGLAEGTTTPTLTGFIRRTVLDDLGLESGTTLHTPSGNTVSNALIGLGFTGNENVEYHPPSEITIGSIVSLNRLGFTEATTAHTSGGYVVHDTLYELGLSEITVPHLSSGSIDSDALMTLHLTAGTESWIGSDHNDVATVEAETTLIRLGFDTLYDTFELVGVDATGFSAYTGGGLAIKDALTDLGIQPGTYPFQPAIEAEVVGDIFGDNDSVTVVPGDSIFLGTHLEERTEDERTNVVDTSITKLGEVEIFFSGSTIDDVVRNINDTMEARGWDITATNVNGQLQLVGDNTDITLRAGVGTALTDIGFRVPADAPMYTDGEQRRVYSYIPPSFVTKSVLLELGLESGTTEYTPWGNADVNSTVMNGLGLLDGTNDRYTRTSVFVTGSVSNPTVTTENFFINGVQVPLTGKTIPEVAADITNANIPGVTGDDQGDVVTIRGTNVDLLLEEGSAGVANPINAEVIGTRSNPAVVGGQDLEINGVLVTLSGGDEITGLTTTVNDINFASIPGIVATTIASQLRIVGTGVDITIGGRSQPIILDALGLSLGTTPHVPARAGTLEVLGFDVISEVIPMSATVTGAEINPLVIAPDNIVINDVKFPFSSPSIGDLIGEINEANANGFLPGVVADSSQFLGIESAATMSIDNLVSGIENIVVDQDGGMDDLGFTAGTTTSNIGIVNGTEFQPAVYGNFYINGIEIVFGETEAWENVVSTINDKLISVGSNVVAYDNVGYIRLVGGNGTGSAGNTVTIGNGTYGTALTDLGLTRHNIIISGSVANARPYVGDTVIINGVEVVFTGDEGERVTTGQAAVNITEAVPNVDAFVFGSNQIQLVGRGFPVTIAAGNRNTVTVTTTTDHNLLVGQNALFQGIVGKTTVSSTNASPVFGATDNFTLNSVVIEGDSIANFILSIEAKVTAGELVGVTASEDSGILTITGLTNNITLADGVGTPLAELGIVPGTYTPEADGVILMNNQTYPVSSISGNGRNFVVDNVALLTYNDYGSGGEVETADVLPLLGLGLQTVPVNSSTGFATAVGTVENPQLAVGSAIAINGQAVVFSTPQPGTSVVGLTELIGTINSVFNDVEGYRAENIVLSATGVNLNIGGSNQRVEQDLGISFGRYERVATVTGTVSEPTATIPPSIFIDNEEVFFTLGQNGIATARDIADSINLAAALAIANTGGSSNPSPLVYISSTVDAEGRLQIRKTGGSGSTTLTLAVGQNITADILSIFGMQLETASSGGMRVGQLRFMVEPGAESFSMDDQYNLTANDVDVTFSGKFENGLFILTYENAEATDVTFNYTFDLWKI